MNRRSVLAGAPPKAPPSHSLSPGAAFFTNAELLTQEGKTVRFYDDIIKDRFVAVNFIYTSCEGKCSLATAKLVQVKKLLEAQGSGIQFCSITLKPWEDGPQELKAYAQAHGADWTFLTGNDYDLTTIRFRFGRWEHVGLDFDVEQHSGMVRAVNDRLNRWSMSPTSVKAESVAKTLLWAAPTRPLEQRIQEGYAIRDRLNAEMRELMSPSGDRE